MIMSVFKSGEGLDRAGNFLEKFVKVLSKTI